MKLICLILCFFTSVNSYSESLMSILTPMLRLCVSDESDLEKTYEELTGQYLPSSVFDKIGYGKVEILFLNDFDFKDQNGPDPSKINDDVGRTHGMKISIYKNIAPKTTKDDQYYINISYESNLYTNSNLPDKFSDNYRDTLYWDEARNVYVSDIFFKEENLFKVLIGKAKTYDALYWEVGVGYHEVNTEDINRGFFISSVKQQQKFHQIINEYNENTFREYNYLEQDESQAGGMVEFRIGRDKSLYSKNANRVYLRYGAQGRLSNIKKANFIGGHLHLGYEHDEVKRYYIPAVRLQAGIEHMKYEKNDYSEYFIEIGTSNEYVTTKFKYTVPLSDDPHYLNPLPLDFERRDSLTPRQEPTISLTVEGKIR